jgi:hypothetical protein
MIKDWNVDRVIGECQRMYMGANDPYMTGWNNWPCKQDLYRVKFAVDEMLAKTSTFLDEPEWLAEQQLERDQKKVWKALNEVQNLR